MKIAIVCKNLSFITGGPRLALSLARHLGELGQEVVLYAAEAEGEYFREISKGLDVRVTPPGFTRGEITGLWNWVFGKLKEQNDDIKWAKTVAAAMDSDFDVVNVHDLTYRTGYFYKKRNKKAKVVWQENIPLFLYVKRGKFIYDLIGFLYWRFKKFVDQKYYDSIDKISVLDELTKERRIDRGFPSHNISVIRAGIDFPKFYAPVKDFSLKAERKQVNIFALGALNFVRRFDNVIEAVKYLRDWGYDARAKIIAKNVWHQDECRDRLIELVKENNLKDFIDLDFKGLPEEDLVKVFQESDIFVQAVYAPPPAHQGWGLVNFEAMAAGLPLVVVRSSSATEVLEEDKTALFFDPLEPKQIAEKIKFLVDNPQAYDHIAKAGQAYVKENQSWKKYAEETLKLFS